MERGPNDLPPLYARGRQDEGGPERTHRGGRGGGQPHPGGGQPHPGGGQPHPGGGQPHPRGGYTNPGGSNPHPGGRYPHPGGGYQNHANRQQNPGGRYPHPASRQPYSGGGAGQQRPIPHHSAGYQRARVPEDIDTKKRRLLSGGYTKFNDEQIQNVKLDKVSLYSISSADDAHDTAVYISELHGIRETDLDRQPIVTDGCAGGGGNVMQLACSGLFSKVIAVEMDATRMRDNLKPNVELAMRSCQSQTETVFVTDSYIDQITQLTQDVVFLDPPWGGPEYKKKDSVQLFLGDMELGDVVRFIHNERVQAGTRYVVLKVPKNFDIGKFKMDMQGMRLAYTLTPKLSYNIICISFMDQDHGSEDHRENPRRFI